jgi:organizing structure protein 2
VRLFIYAHSLAAENAFNDTLSRVLHVESRFTNTIASLAPPLESGERLLPGAVYVLVSAMAGSIISRNRGILLRTATPVAIGTVAAYALLPITMRNVGDLVWEYERRVPALAENHVRVRTIAEESWRRAVAHKGFARDWLEAKVGDGREVLEDWLKRGK